MVHVFLKIHMLRATQLDGFDSTVKPCLGGVLSAQGGALSGASGLTFEGVTNGWHVRHGADGKQVGKPARSKDSRLGVVITFRTRRCEICCNV